MDPPAFFGEIRQGLCQDQQERLERRRSDLRSGTASDHAIRCPRVPEQKDLLALHRVRARLINERTALCCQIRGLLAEYGIVLPVTVPQLRRELPRVLDDAENELTVRARQLITSLRDELYSLQERIEPHEQAIEQASMNSDACRRLRDIPGVGPISATAIVATMGDSEVFKNGRHFAA
jgi:transposase